MVMVTAVKRSGRTVFAALAFQGCSQTCNVPTWSVPPIMIMMRL
jgi:hypothetical protein